MKLGISSYTFPWSVGVDGHLPDRPMLPMDLLHKAKQLGVDCLQIGDNLPLHYLSEFEINELAAKAEAFNLQIEVGTRRLEKQHIEKYINIASIFKSPFLRVVIDDEEYKPDSSIIIQEISTLLPHLESANLVLAIENHDRFPSMSLAHIIERTSKKYVGICLDTANSIGAGEGVKEVIHHLAPYTVNLHIKDIQIRRLSHKMGFEIQGCAAGQGDIDIPFLLETMKVSQRCESITLEIWSDYMGDIIQTIQREKVWGSESINYLKNLLLNID